MVPYKGPFQRTIFAAATARHGELDGTTTGNGHGERPAVGWTGRRHLRRRRHHRRPGCRGRRAPHGPAQTARRPDERVLPAVRSETAQAPETRHGCGIPAAYVPGIPHWNYFPRAYSWSMLSVVNVPLTLLGLLERGPSHGYDLKRDYDAYFGRGRPLRYSQVYATLFPAGPGRKGGPRQAEQGAGPERRRYVITEAGIAEVERWLAEPAAGAEPDQRAVRQGGARPDARPPGRPLPGRPAGGAPAADASSSPSSSVSPIRSACCSPTTRYTVWRRIFDGSTTPRPGWTCSPGRCTDERGSPRRGCPGDRERRRGAGPSPLVRQHPRAARRVAHRPAGGDRRGHGAERVGQVNLAALPGGHPGP